MLQTQVTFLGHVVSERGVQPNPDNVKKVQEWPIPSSVKHARQFLGMASYYRRFVKGVSDIAHPMVELTKKHTKFKWDASCQTSFDTLKGKLTSTDIMAYPQDDGMYTLDTDAGNFSVGEQSGTEQ